MLKQLFQRIIMVAAILTVMLCTSSYAGTCRVKERSSHTAGSSANNVCSVYGCRKERVAGSKSILTGKMISRTLRMQRTTGTRPGMISDE